MKYLNKYHTLSYDNKHKKTKETMGILTCCLIPENIATQTRIEEDDQGIIEISRSSYGPGNIQTIISIKLGQPNGYTSLRVWGEIRRTIYSKSSHEFTLTSNQHILRSFRNTYSAANYIREMLISV